MKKVLRIADTIHANYILTITVLVVHFGIPFLKIVLTKNVKPKFFYHKKLKKMSKGTNIFPNLAM